VSAEAAQRELAKIRNVPSVEQQRQTAQDKLQSSVKKRFELAMKGAVSMLVIMLLQPNS